MSNRLSPISTSTSRPSAACRSANLAGFRSLALLTTVAVLTLSACGEAGPAPSDGQPSDLPSTQATSTPSPSGSASDTLTLVDLDDATDPGAAAQHELVLNQEARADGGMAALIGDDDDAVFDELDAQASAFSQGSLEQIAHLVDTGEMPEGATSEALAEMLAVAGSGLPMLPNTRNGNIDLSLFTETGFTTSALLAVATSAISLADQTNNG